MLTFGPAGTEYRIDDRSLRAVPENPAAMRTVAVEWEQQALAGGAPSSEAAATVSRAAMLFAMVGELARAESLLRSALAVQSHPTLARAQVVSTVRLGQVLQLQNLLTEAEAVLTEAVNSCRATEAFHPLLDFTLQHLGKIYFEQARYSEAEASFVEALALREQKADPELVTSSRQALAAVRLRLHEPA